VGAKKHETTRNKNGKQQRPSGGRPAAGPMRIQPGLGTNFFFRESMRLYTEA